MSPAELVLREQVLVCPVIVIKSLRNLY
jgi:hypothetical protein